MVNCVVSIHEVESQTQWFFLFLLIIDLVQFLENSTDLTETTESDQSRSLFLVQVLEESILFNPFQKLRVLVMGDGPVRVQESLLLRFFIIAGDDNLIVVSQRTGSVNTRKFVCVLITDHSDKFNRLFRVGIKGINELSSLLIKSRVA